jgi:hypothetical protein
VAEGSTYVHFNVIYQNGTNLPPSPNTPPPPKGGAEIIKWKVVTTFLKWSVFVIKLLNEACIWHRVKPLMIKYAIVCILQQCYFACIPLILFRCTLKMGAICPLHQYKIHIMSMKLDLQQIFYSLQQSSKNIWNIYASTFESLSRPRHC